MNIEIQLAKYSEKPLLKKMLELYLYELSVFCDEQNTSKELPEKYPCFDLYWTEAERFPFLLRVDKTPSGFAFINNFARIGNIDRAVAEFCVLKNFRRRGIGKKFAAEIFLQFLGRWQVSCSANNITAQKFWQSTIEEFMLNSSGSLEQLKKRKDRKTIIWTFGYL